MIFQLCLKLCNKHITALYMMYHRPTHHWTPNLHRLMQHILSVLLSFFIDYRGIQSTLSSHLWRDTGLWNKTLLLNKYFSHKKLFWKDLNSGNINVTETIYGISTFVLTAYLFLQLQIHYDKQLGNLIVHVLQARNLAPRDNNGYSDPFVKVYLLPGRGWVRGVETSSTP